MLLRRLLIVLMLIALVSVSALAGVVAANWPFYKRVLTAMSLADTGEWPDSFYTPIARIDGGGAAQMVVASEEGGGIAAGALEAAARWAEAHNSVALLVWHRGSIVLERYWQGMTAEMPFSGRAMTRSLVGMVYGFAVAEGRLSLDDRADRFLPEWRGDPRGAITLRHLLQNVSGLEEVPLNAAAPPAEASAPRRAWLMVRAYHGKNSLLSLGTDFAAAALSFDAHHAPGERFALSNANAQILGTILERATGEPYERYVERRLWRPIGGGQAEFYLDRANGMPAVYCCFRATARDYLRLGELLVDDGRYAGRQVLPAGWVAQMATTSSANPLYGLQIWSGRARAGTREYQLGTGVGVEHGEDFRADDVLWMEGGGGRTVWAIPSRQLVIVRLGRAARGWDGSVIPNTVLGGMSP